MKNRGSLFGFVSDVTDGWVDIRLRTGGTATIFTKYDLAENLKAYFFAMKHQNICLEFSVYKNKNGDFGYIGYKAHAGARIKQKTARIKAEAEMRTIEMESLNMAKGRSSKSGKSRVSLSPKKSSKVNYNVRQLVTGATRNEGKPMEYLP